MKENILLGKATKFGVKVIKFARNLEDKVLAKQILRSGTSIGANIAESEYASSMLDFINKLQIAQKEAGETRYWLILLHEANYVSGQEYKALCDDVNELMRMLSKSITTSKSKIK